MKHDIMKLQITLIGLSILFLGSCASPKLTNTHRGKYLVSNVNVHNDALDVRVSVLPLPQPKKKAEEKPKSFFDLRDSIPHVFLKEVSRHVDSIPDMIEAIRTPLSIVKKKISETKLSNKNLSDIKVRFKIGLVKDYKEDTRLLHPNTRIRYLNTKIRIDDSSSVSIYTIDRLENQHESIDMGTLSRDHKVDFKTGLVGESSAEFGSEVTNGSESSFLDNASNNNTQNVYDANGNLIGSIVDGNTINFTGKNSDGSSVKANAKQSVKADLNYASSESIKESLALKNRELKTGFSFNTKDITITQRSLPNEDVIDNVFVTATLRYDPLKIGTITSTITKFEGLFKDNTFQKACNIKTDDYYFKYISCNRVEDVKFNIESEGLFRAVKNQVKGRNRLEYDDKVEYIPYEETNTNPVVLNKYNYCNKIYEIVASVNSSGVTKELLLYIIPTGKQLTQVLLTNEEDPSALISWLNDAISRNKSAINLNCGSMELRFISRSLQIPIVKDAMTDSDLREIDKIEKIYLRESKP